ncbi:uncharacterized protein LOC144001670 [Festucalex cinctus]
MPPTRQSSRRLATSWTPLGARSVVPLVEGSRLKVSKGTQTESSDFEEGKDVEAAATHLEREQLDCSQYPATADENTPPPENSQEVQLTDEYIASLEYSQLLMTPEELNTRHEHLPPQQPQESQQQQPQQQLTSDGDVVEGCPPTALPSPTNLDKDWDLVWNGPPDSWLCRDKYNCIKQTIGHLLNQVIVKYSRDECNGCLINHPSQRQHQCLEIDDDEYFRKHYHRVIALLCTPKFLPSIHYMLNLLHLTTDIKKVKTAAEIVLLDLEQEKKILDKLEQLDALEGPGSLSNDLKTLLDKYYNSK